MSWVWNEETLMPKIMKTMALASLVLCAAFAAANSLFPVGWVLSMEITFGTIAYHFWMRLLVGYAYDRTMKNRADYNHPWFRTRPWEMRLYERIKVRRWKGKMPTYQPELFSPEKHSWDEIAQAMCQSELVHETIAVLSFVPVAAAGLFGALPVFLVTSVCAACFDLLFVIMQRFNRPLVVRLAERERRKMKSTQT